MGIVTLLAGRSIQTPMGIRGKKRTWYYLQRGRAQRILFRGGSNPCAQDALGPHTSGA